MKVLLHILVMICCVTTYAQVGIGTETPHNSSLLDISSNNKGALFPRLTTAQRTNINAPAKGLLVYDTNFKSFWFYNGVNWDNIDDIPGDNLGSHLATQNIELNNRYLSNDGGNEGISVDNSGNVGISTSVTNRLNIGFGGIRLTNSEIGNTSNTSGVLFYSENFYSSGQAGHPYFTGNGGGLALKNEDGWSALISTANMDYLDMELKSVDINTRAIIDNKIKINGGNPGYKKFLVSDADGDASWDQITDIDAFAQRYTTTHDHSDDDIFTQIIPNSEVQTIAVEVGDKIVIQYLGLARLKEGSGQDPFELRSRIRGCASTNLETFRIEVENEGNNGHNFWQQYVYLNYWDATCTGNITVHVDIRNIGDDEWSVKDSTLIIRKN